MARRNRRPERVIAAVLLTDIVGSTEIVARVGDRAWKDLLARHNAAVRRELVRFRGREIDTAGDGFFAVFDQPSSAIQCAAAIIDAVGPLGIRIRAAVHMGECEVMGDKVGGTTVHVAARVREHAQPDEILVTRTVQEVAAGAGMTFEAGGVRELRGLPGTWPLFAVRLRPEFEFRLLGPLEVLRAGRAVQLGGGKQRSITALLLLEANRVVPTDRLVDELWGDDPPAAARDVLQVHISNLRKSLAGFGSRSPVVTRAPGYVLEIDSEHTDLGCFDRLRRQARTAVQSGDREQAAILLREALALWRGAALADVPEAFAQHARARLEEERARAFEELVDAELALGRHADIIHDLRSEIASHPYRERLRAQLMLALYRSGRQADALSEYQRARRVLVDELGIEPGSELQELQREILRQEPSLALDAATRVGADTGEATVEPAGRPAPRSRSSAAAAAVLVLLAAGIVAAAWRAGPGAPSLTSVSAGSVALVEEASGRILAGVRVGTSPKDVIGAEGSVWVTDDGDRTLVRLDSRSRSVTRTYGLDDVPTGLVGGDGRIWVANAFSGTLSRLLVAEDVLTGGISPKPGVSGRVALAHERGALWIGLRDETVVRIDPFSGALTGSIEDVGSPQALAAFGETVWLVGDEAPALRRLDPAAGRVTSTTQLRGALTDVTATADAVWVAGTIDNRVWRIDPTTAQVVATVAVSEPPTAVAVDEGGSLWVASGPAGTISRIDPSSNRVASTVRIGGQIGGVTAVDGVVWVTVR